MLIKSTWVPRIYPLNSLTDLYLPNRYLLLKHDHNVALALDRGINVQPLVAPTALLCQLHHDQVDGGRGKKHSQLGYLGSKSNVNLTRFPLARVIYVGQ